MSDKWKKVVLNTKEKLQLNGKFCKVGICNTASRRIRYWGSKCSEHKNTKTGEILIDCNNTASLPK